MAWLMLQYLTGGAWGMVIRRPAEAAARTLPLVALMFLPIVIGIPNLYAWSHAANVAADPCCSTSTPYLNLPFFLIRAAVYFAGWMFLAWYYEPLVRRGGSRRARRSAHGKMSALAGPGLIFWGFSVTFMAIDWVLSLDPKWFSTMFGLLFMAGQGLTVDGVPDHPDGAAFLPPPMSDVLTPRHLHDLGKFLLALVMVWAYFSFSQFLIIWAGNLPEEIPWYLSASTAAGRYVALALVCRPLRAAVRAAALARSEAQFQAAGVDRGLHPVHAPGGSVLAGGAGVSQGRRSA